MGGNSVVRPEAVNPPVLGMDTFSLWEFDGTDWVQRFEPGDTRLPVSFQKRRSVTAVWHPVRQTTILFGGFVDVLDSCPYSGATLDLKRFTAESDATRSGRAVDPEHDSDVEAKHQSEDDAEAERDRSRRKHRHKD